MTPELVYRYKMAVRGLEDILESDLNTLKEIHQVSGGGKTFQETTFPFSAGISE